MQNVLVSGRFCLFSSQKATRAHGCGIG